MPIRPLLSNITVKCVSKGIKYMLIKQETDYLSSELFRRLGNLYATPRS